MIFCLQDICALGYVFISQSNKVNAGPWVPLVLEHLPNLQNLSSVLRVGEGERILTQCYSAVLALAKLQCCDYMRQNVEVVATAAASIILCKVLE